MEPLVLAGEVEAPVFPEVAVADDRAEGEDGFGAVQAPSGPSYVEAVGDEVPACLRYCFGGQVGTGARPDGKRMFFARTNSRSVSGAFSRPKPLPFTPPNGVPRKARRM